MLKEALQHWNIVEDSPKLKRLVAELTIGSQVTMLDIPAVKSDSITELSPLPEGVFADTDVSFVAFRYGDRGMYLFQLNEKVVEISSVNRHIDGHEGLMGWNPEKTINVEGEDMFKPIIVDVGESVEACGNVIETGEQFTVKLVATK